jgi:hypothetical protein
MSPAFAMSQGKLPMGLDNLMGGGGPDAPAPAAIPAASTVLSPEELAKQKDAVLRAQATRGQQAAAAGAPRAQGSSQVGNQVRQPFKHGGGLRQMVNLPSNRVQFGKAAYANGTTDEELAELQRRQDLMATGEYFSPLTLDITENIVNPVVEGYGSAKQGLKDFIGESSSYLAGTGDASFKAEREELMAQEAKEGEEAAKQAAAAAEQKAAEEERMNALRDRNAADKKPAGEDLFLSPEEAAYSSLIDSDAGQNAAKRYFAGENVGLANISEALKAYKGFKDTEMAQRRLIDADTRKKAAATAAARRARLEDQLTMAKIADKLSANDKAALAALTERLRYDPDNEGIQAQIDMLTRKALTDPIAQVVGKDAPKYGTSPGTIRQVALENEVARQLAVAAAQKAKEG